jgi:hypothetical protein
MGSIKLAFSTYIDEARKFDDGFNGTAYWITEKLDYVFNTIYFIEFFIKAITMGLVVDKNCYLSVGWNKLDFIIVVSSANEMLLAGEEGGELEIL